MKKWIAILALILCVALLAVACKTGDDGKGYRCQYLGSEDRSTDL